MNENLRLGEIDGIPIGMNWSILFVFALFAWELSDIVLPAYHPHDATATYWIVGIVTTAMFFISLLAHEVSHAVIAKRNNIRVRGITLWLFGGVSELESEALSPGVDFRIAVAGPLTSFALVIVFGVFGVFIHQSAGISGIIVSALGWLAWMNLLLGCFNLLPAAPLDGGRVLRAVLWRSSGDRLRAGATAARAGQVLAFILIALGILEFLAGELIGLWLLFLGWFLLAAARSEHSTAVMRSSLAHVRVRDIMTKNPVTFDGNTVVSEFIDHQLAHYRFNAFPLTGENGQFVGLTTMSRLRHVANNKLNSTRLIDIASPANDVPQGSPDEPVADLLTRMQSSPDGRALIVDGSGHLAGIVSPSDISRYIQLCMMQSRGRTDNRS
jgi:Zn-dependent protease